MEVKESGHVLDVCGEGGRVRRMAGRKGELGKEEECGRRKEKGKCNGVKVKKRTGKLNVS